MTPELFQQLADQGYNRIPVSQTIFADLDTPLSSYLKLAKGPYSYLFESVQGGEKWGRYSILGLPARTVLKVFDHQVQICENGKVVKEQVIEDPLAFVENYRKEFRVPELSGQPEFTGGLVGYFAYDCVRYIEPKLFQSQPAKDELGVPNILLMVSDEVLIFDNLSGTLHLIVHGDPSQENAFDIANARLNSLASRLPGATEPLPSMNLEPSGLDEEEFISGMGEAGFKSAVEKIRQYILAGDCMQVVPSQRLSTDFNSEPINLYRAIRNLNPSPYLFFLDLDDHQVVGSSPEILARLENGEVTVRPIAGTRKRGQSEQEDLALEKDLLADPKEVAEHLMLIDLGRNDVGRVAKTGTVEVTEQMVIERYSHVMHIISNVVGQIEPGWTAMDVLRAALPAGTLSGAPKIRAMEIIDELEPVKRGIYGGAVGYLGWQGNMDTAIAIRTAVIKDQRLYLQAGAGVVWDSDPQSEWDETMNKARAMIKAVAMVKALDKAKDG